MRKLVETEWKIKEEPAYWGKLDGDVIGKESLRAPVLGGRRTMVQNKQESERM